MRLRLGQALGAFPRPGGGISPLYVFFTVTNAGGDEATVAGLHVEPKGGSPVHVAHLLEGENRPPGVVLAPGETVRFRVRAKGLASALKDAGHGGRPRVDLVVVDGSGGHSTQRFRFRMDEYLELKDE